MRYVLLCPYAALLLVLLNSRPLWLDEILQLTATRDSGWLALMEWTARNPGAAPLGYLPQWMFLQMSGYSVAAARFVPAMCSVASCAALGALARSLRLPWSGVAITLFAVLPIQLRYAVESRPYSQGLLCVILASIAAVRLSRRPGIRRAALYCVALTGAVYSQPYAAFVAAGHLLWFACWEGERRVRAQRLAFCAAAAAGLLFLPWVFYARHHWSPLLSYGFSHHSLFVMLREPCGGGYALSGLMLALAGVGALRGRVHLKARLLLITTTVMPVVGALATDAAFGYFFAARQLLFLLPSLVLLAVEGLRVVVAMSRGRGLVLAAGLAVLCVWHDVRWFRGAHEDWAMAAALLRDVPAEFVVVAPRESIGLYRFFEPGLRECGLSDSVGSVALAVTPYTAAGADVEAIERSTTFTAASNSL